MDLSISIATYNSCEMTARALTSILSLTHSQSFEVIVVDNGSTDGSAETLAHRFPDVQLIKSNRNIGFARAHSLALARDRPTA